MIIIPSIDLPHPDQSHSVDARRPREVIREWEWLGFQWVHLVEAPAIERRLFNRQQVEDLLGDIHIDAQVAGDIRSVDDIEALTRAGAGRIVVGARALDEPDWLSSTVSTFPSLLLVETAARERRVRSRGWVRTLPVDARDVAAELADFALAGLLVTFPSDAEFEHGDLALLEDLSERMPFPILVGGGLQSLASLRDLEFRGVNAAVIDWVRLADSFDELSLARIFVE